MTEIQQLEKLSLSFFLTITIALLAHTLNPQLNATSLYVLSVEVVERHAWKM